MYYGSVRALGEQPYRNDKNTLDDIYAAIHNSRRPTNVTKTYQFPAADIFLHLTLFYCSQN